MTSHDLHPLQYKNYINNGGMTRNCAALKIQRVWRKYVLNKNINNNMKSVPERFFSWFGF
jgi:hypothetical protein